MSLQDNFLFIINPISGGNNKTELIKTVKEFAEKRNVHLVDYETTGENDVAKIQQLHKDCKPRRILVAGGDGTIKMVAEAMDGHNIIIGVLPAGSSNGLSVDLNLPKTLQANLEVAFNDSFIEMDIVNINGKMSLHLSDIGVNAELIKNYESGRIRGKLGYALQVISTLTDLDDPFIATIKANGETIETEARMVVIANTNRYGTGVTINPIGKMDDGKFEIVILKNLDVLVIGKILSGNIPVDNNDDVVIISTDEAVITTNVPVSFQVDGEFCGEEERLDIKIMPRQMKVAVPAAKES